MYYGRKEKVTMDKESLKEDFNQDIKRTFEQGKPKVKLENDIDNLIKEYMRKVESEFNTIPNRVNVEIYFKDRFAELKRIIDSKITDITNNVSTFFIRVNDSEYDKNIEVLSNDKMNDEIKKDELDQNAKNKKTILEQEKNSINSGQKKDIEWLKQEVDAILEKTCNYAKRDGMTTGLRSSIDI